MITIRNLWKTYDSTPVLKGINFIVPPSSITIILGRSGVGKSVLLKQIAGIEQPDQGSIEIENIDLCSLSEHKRRQYTAQIGMLFQGSALFDSMTIQENIAFAMTEKSQAKIDEALENVGLIGFNNKYPAELSGGQKRRAAIARLVAYKPKILLFDEPTTGLDPITAQQIISLIQETQRSLQATALIVTHDLVLAEQIGEYFALHDEGIIQISGNRQDFFNSNHPLVQAFISGRSVP